jgi:intraflagellar transport protein 80
MLHKLVLAKQWENAIRLARLVKEPAAWACLAALAIQAKELSTAEIAYAAVDAVCGVNGPAVSHRQCG